MPISNLLMSGVELMLLGMGIVFGFLTLLVFALRGMSKLAEMLHDGRDAAMASGPVFKTTQTSSIDDEEVIAAISVAISHYRKKLGKKILSLEI